MINGDKGAVESLELIKGVESIREVKNREKRT